MWCCSALRTDGLRGFRDGLELLAGLLEQYLPVLYPALDPEDNNDPTQRLNILSALAVPRGSSRGGWMTFVDADLYATPVCQPRGGATVTFDELLSTEAFRGISGPAAAVIRAAPAKQISAHRETLAEALEAVKKIDRFLTATLGVLGDTISFEILESTLTAINQALTRLPAAARLPRRFHRLPPRPPRRRFADNVFGGFSARPGAVAGGCASATGEDLRRLRSSGALSPVPYLLRRAHALVNMNFLPGGGGIELRPDGVSVSPGHRIGR